MVGMQKRTVGDVVEIPMVKFSRSFAVKGHRQMRRLLEKIVVSRDAIIFKMRDITICAS